MYDSIGIRKIFCISCAQVITATAQKRQRLIVMAALEATTLHGFDIPLSSLLSVYFRYDDLIFLIQFSAFYDFSLSAAQVYG